MKEQQLHDLAIRIEGASWPNPELGKAILDAVKSAIPEESAPGMLEPQLMESTDAALHLVSTQVPGWSVNLEGAARETQSHWLCTLRESTASDDDELIGIGAGPTPPLAVIAALLRIIVIRARGRW